MHAVVVKVTINELEAAEALLQEQVVPRVSQAPGFVAGYWTRSDDKTNGLSVIAFESEDAARAAAEQMPPPSDAVNVDSIEVREVVASA
jgi:heme-degrading monooxygenase HmoA